jgi:hypothetical protein
MPNYNNSKIYKIWSTQTDDIYIGSTTQPLSKRIGDHRSKSKGYQNGKYHYVTSFKILDYGDAKIELIEKVNCKCKEELTAREGHYIRTLECVNKYIPGRNLKQHYQDNKEKILQQNKQYRQDNKDKIKQYHKQYRQDNKDKIKQYHKQYKQDNKDKLSQKSKQYYQDNKEKWTRGSVKNKCECGSIVSKYNLTRHKKSKKHLAFM